MRIFDALPRHIVTLRIAGLDTHDLLQPQSCLIARTLDGLICSVRDGTLRNARDLKLISLDAAIAGCERCDSRLKALDMVCQRRNILLDAPGVLAKVRSSRDSFASVLTSDSRRPRTR